MADEQNGKIPHIGDDDFQTKVMENSKATLVDFWAPWCGPCKMLAPILEEVADEIGDSADIVKMNVDENPTTAGTYGIMSIPTVMVFQGGEVKETFVGVQNKQTYVDALNKYKG